jgi:hypothetical protein
VSDPSIPPPNTTELYGRVGVPISIAILVSGLGGFATDHTSLGYIFVPLGVVGLAVMVHLLNWHRFTTLHALISTITALLFSWALLAYVIWTKPKEVIVHDPPTIEDIERAGAPIRKEFAAKTQELRTVATDRDAEKQRADSATQQLATYQTQFPTLQSNLATATRERDNLRRSLEETTSLLNAARAQLGPKSEFLGLDDAKRWNIVTTMYQWTQSGQCSAMMGSDLGRTPDGSRSQKVFNEVSQTLVHAGWIFPLAIKSFLPPGITITTGGGHEHECALRLTDLLKSLNISPVTLTTDENNQDLVKCQCIEVDLGKLDRP